MTDPNEPLIEGLDDVPGDALDGPDAPDELRASLLARTTGMVRARRRRRHALRAAAAVLIFAAGAATGQSLRADPAPTAPTPRPVAKKSEDTLPTNPEVLVARLAEATPDERARAMRDAGDRYLDPAHADPAAALYCYQRHLAEATETSDVVGVDDGWLLTYLKLQTP